MTTPLPALLEDAGARQHLRPLDLAFARFLAERDPHASPALLLLAALLSRQLADGHPCLDLRTLDALADEHAWPDAWRAALAAPLPASSLLAGADGLPADAPLVLDGPRLYLRRYWNHERRVAQDIAARLGREVPPPGEFAAELGRLFPHQGRNAPFRDDAHAVRAGDATPDWPRIACALAARGAFGVVTGGPGTGKTTTVVRLLGLLQTLHLRRHAQALRIRLAAPTGKAAARLGAAIADQLARLDVDEAVRAAIPTRVDTLHRLLGARPDSRRFRHDRANPLHLDVLVVDEASMVDLETMAALLDALPARARLVLLGDKDQLSSVEAGAVLGDLCRRAEAGHYDEATAAWLREAGCGDVAAFVRDDAQALDQQVAMLRHSHRFDAGSGIGRLAQAVNAGDVAAVRALLADPGDDLEWHADAARIVDLAVHGHVAAADDAAAPRGYRHYLERLRRERPVAGAGEAAFAAWADRALQDYAQFQLLCALRHGPSGTQSLNQRIAAALHAAGLVESDQGWYEGRPVMVLRNDYTLGLMNGDVGIALRRPGPDGEPRLYVAFPDTGTTASARRDAPVRFVLPTRLEAVDTVYAMTVHKSQGSEFGHTALLLPDQAGSLLTRELLYTGITRARRHFSLIAPLASVELAVAQRTRRHSGLAERLAKEICHPVRRQSQ
ncbi:exodeoxyribonuclease V subunit alpha [Fulvimonas sp. R45]|uniref:exodeoxyribonuclease V subunit alpha n=1 Tax=Fulvimonas sp. R45 TaxID=3045937 RepID=UPI00265E6F28|nr:exodeoxyribonuclease V subunit alpha [Fulvimonas sp. R45]MDO1527498.1 exodeoxyribonuclease V subunit alpha [Fulvimonas sp. R45]